VSRLAALDYGKRRIGVALSDPTGTIAYPLTTLTRREGKRPPWPQLTTLLHEHEVQGVVIGLPLDLAGEEGEWAAEVRAFGVQVERRTSLPVHWVDERLTSVLAERTVRGMGLKRSDREKKGRVDATAAALILEAYLARARSGESESHDG
jgi:putative holliday junction resolvase